MKIVDINHNFNILTIGEKKIIFNLCIAAWDFYNTHSVNKLIDAIELNNKKFKLVDNSFLYAGKINEGYWIVSDFGYILSHKNISNIMYKNEDGKLDITSALNEIAKKLDISYANDNYQMKYADVNNYINIADNYFVVVRDKDMTKTNVNDIVHQFNKLYKNYQKLAYNNVNLPLNKYNVLKTIDILKNDSAKYLYSNFTFNKNTSFDINNIYKNNNFDFTIDTKSSYLSTFNLLVERVPNELIQVNSIDEYNDNNSIVNNSVKPSINLPAWCVRDNGIIFKKLSSFVKFTKLLDYVTLFEYLIEKSDYKFRIHQLNTDISMNMAYYPTIFNENDKFEILIFGSSRSDMANMFNDFYNLSKIVLEYININKNVDNIEDKILEVLNSNVSSYKIHNDFGIPSNKISDLRKHPEKIDSLSFRNVKKLEAAYNKYTLLKILH